MFWPRSSQNKVPKTNNNFLVHLLFGSLKKQLIWGVAVIHALMMSLFIWDLTERQTEILLDRQSEHAQALARSVATSTAGWVAARDLYGLQEIINAQARYPELQFAMVTEKNGQILAHSDTGKIGLYLDDLPETVEDHLISRNDALVDAVSPVTLAGKHIGWVRIGLGQKTISKKIDVIVNNGLIYTILAILLGSILSWLLAGRVSRKLNKIEHTAKLIQQGSFNHRADVRSDDEVDNVARAINQMLDSIIESQQALTESEDRFNHAVSATNDGVWDWDPITNVVYYSPRWKSMVGYREDEVENKFASWEALVDPEGKQATLDAIDKIIKGEQNSFATEFRMRHKNGNWVDILSRGKALRDESGKPYRLVGTHTDITHRKQLEKELTGHRDHLEKLVEERTRELAEAQRKAEEANIEKSRFLANMSHELRTPMHAILSYANLSLKKIDDTQKIEGYLKNIQQSGTRLTNLLNDLLDLSKLESGKMDVSFAPEDLIELVQRCITEVKSLLLEKQLHIDFDTDRVVIAEIDSKLMTQTMVNLLSNAIKFSPTDSMIHINLEQTTDKEGNETLTLSVIDEGVGIPVGETEAIFEKFVQSSNTRTQAGGTGLGLPITRQIVGLHHGSIWAESPPRGYVQGSAFYIQIPTRQPV